MSPLSVFLLFMALLSFVLGAYDINRGKNLEEGEQVGGWGAYWGRTGFLIRGVAALFVGLFLLILTIHVAISA